MNYIELEQYPSPLRVPIISSDGVELTKNLAFNELTLNDKIDLFNSLCDYRLWCNDALDVTKDYSLEELRHEPLGKDSKGYEYWYFSGTRLYRGKKELMDEIIRRNQRISKLNYKLVELEKCRIIREKEEKKKAEIEKAKREAAEARERLLAIKKQAEVKPKKIRKEPPLPPRTGLRERRTSTVSNTNTSTTSKQTRQPCDKVTRSSKLTNGTKKTIEPVELPEDPILSLKKEIEELEVAHEERCEAWRMECESLEDWEKIVVKFEKSKSTNEKYLYYNLNEYVFPQIQSIYHKRISEARRKEKEMLLSLVSRRVSSRIICRRAQKEEEERQAQLLEQEMRRKKVEAESRVRTRRRYMSPVETETPVQIKEEPIEKPAVLNAPITGRSSTEKPVLEHQVNDERIIKQVIEELIFDVQEFKPPVAYLPNAKEPDLDETIIDKPELEETIMEDPIYEELVIEESVVDIPMDDEQVGPDQVSKQVYNHNSMERPHFKKTDYEYDVKLHS